MTLAEKLTEDMKTSMRAGDADRTGMLRLLRAALKYEEIKTGHVLSDEEAVKILQRESKQRKDASELYRGAGRDDLLAKEQYELTVLAEYLPQLMDEAATKELVERVMSGMGEVTQAQMGTAIGAVLKEAAGKADGALVSKLVRERLAA